MSAGGSDNCTGEVKKKKKCSQQSRSAILRFQHFKQSMPIPSSGFKGLEIKTAQTTASDVSGRRECVCQSARGNGVKPKALAPGLHNAGMTGGLGQGISEVGVGIPSIHPSVFATEEFGV